MAVVAPMAGIVVVEAVVCDDWELIDDALIVGVVVVVSSIVGGVCWWFEAAADVGAA